MNDFDRALMSLEARPPAEAAARLVVLHLHRRHGTQWLSGPRAPVMSCGGGGLADELGSLGVEVGRRRAAPIARLSEFHELYQAYWFRGVVRDAHEGMLGWLEGRYPLDVRFDIPTPDEMLNLQARGRRYVSLLHKPEEQWQARGRHADACDFLLHDLEHAHKFFADPEMQAGQQKFFTALRESRAAFATWVEDPRFAIDLNYLKADMNSHPVHLMKYLKAVVLAAEIRRVSRREPDLMEFWHACFSHWGLRGPALLAALRLNQPEQESDLDHVLLRDFFMEGEGVRENRKAVSHAVV